ncbi:MAG: hypothetical protein ACLUEQ_02645 [Cloacibacillus evryensis]
MIILRRPRLRRRPLRDIEERVGWIAPLMRIPGEGEMQALAEGALRVLRGEEEALVYERE